jgi:anaerobic selenocysteine-containing dehydrogenase
MPASMEVPGYPYPAYPTPARPKVDNPGRKYPFASEAITTGIREATLTGQPYPIKGWMVYATNLLNAMPNQQETMINLVKIMNERRGYRVRRVEADATGEETVAEDKE